MEADSHKLKKRHVKHIQANLSSQTVTSVEPQYHLCVAIQHNNQHTEQNAD